MTSFQRTSIVKNNEKGLPKVYYRCSNCYPNLNIDKGKNYFRKNIAPNFFERIFIQISMIFTKFGSEGGLFIFIGKKN